MDGKLTINRIRNCKGLTIKMDDAKIIGDYSSLDINDISHSSDTKISMKRTQVMTHEEYRRSLDKQSGHGSGYTSYGAGRAGNLTVNRVADCHNTDIEQEKMKISGKFDSVTMNDIERSTDTSISMVGTRVNTGTDPDFYDDSDSDSSSSSSDSDDDMDRKQKDSEKERDADGLPLPATYAYHIAPKFTFNIRLGGGANVTCTFLQEDRVRTIKEFIVELQPSFKNKPFRLQIVDSDPARFVDSEPEYTLIKAGFKEKLELRTLLNTPVGDQCRY